MPAKIDCCGMTDQGRVRKNNQDQFLIAELKKSMLVQACSLPLEQQSRLFGNAQGHLLLVADGMGGHAAGERASQLAVDYMIQRLLNSVHWFFRLEEDVEDDFLQHLQNLLQEAHRRILDDGVVNVENRGMGTTLTMAYAIWPRLYVVHAGDTRCYLIRDGRAECLTRDHTLARQLVENGGMRPEDEAESRWSNVLWNVLGGHGDGDITVEVTKTNLQVGDTVLLCSDGLYRYLDEPGIAEIVSRASNAAEACAELIQLANVRGGEDNITVVIGHFPHPEPSAEGDDLFETAPRDPSDEDTKPQGVK